MYTNVPSNVSTKVLTTVNRIISREYSKWGVQEEGVDQPEYSRPHLQQQQTGKTSGIPKVGSAEKWCRPALVFSTKPTNVNVAWDRHPRGILEGDAEQEGAHFRYGDF